MNVAFSLFRISSLVFAGIMENEFMRIDLTCDGNFIVPRNPAGVDKYPTVLGSNQVCTLVGAKPGSDIISGHDYLETGFQLDTSDIWRRNLLVLIGWYFFFQITQLIAIEYLQVCPTCFPSLLTCSFAFGVETSARWWGRSFCQGRF
jgi:hypothetical protein